jgi:hypothetical protein
MKDADKKVAPDEAMIPNARAGLSPRDMVEGKLWYALRAQPRTPRDCKPKSAARRPGLALDK